MGSIRVEVTHDSICWDTSRDGSAQPHRGATVRVTSGSVTRTGTTGDDGRVTLTNLPTGSATIDVSDVGYAASGPHRQTITAGRTASFSTSIRLSRGGTRTCCNRQHTRRPGGNPTPAYLPWLFWHRNGLIVVRESLWIVFMALFLAFLVGAIVDTADGTVLFTDCFALAGLFLAVFAYLTHVIFGMGAGIPVIVVAALAWVTLLVFAIVAAAIPLPTWPVPLVGVPSLCGVWGCFFVWLIPRFTLFSVERQWWYVFFYALVSSAIAIVVFLLFARFGAPWLWANGGALAGHAVAVFVIAWVFGLAAGGAGHVFRNDGSLQSFTARGDPKLLPYAGYHFCVQGNRGWFSHLNGQDLCYDFAVPQGTHVLAMEEGHVIGWRDDRTHSYYSGGDYENYVWVEHRDGTVARYLHLQRDGVRTINPVLVSNSTGPGPQFTSDVHVHAGQILGLAGSTGVSRFPHIHVGLFARGLPVTAGLHQPETNLGLAFRDASTRVHGGRCFTFRPYQSDNSDRGPIAI